ncbi:uncharacterized protein LOC128232422 isoform X2 [Mya arenaria]|uniref:uncharacterized protein LOC128232255 isoform X2 n=1 Tax=Mya arenaria TaxID=6604 RepID=UPI0022E5454F|nr:uncharacterized protein LOC128232255 isoform X2 [Mya arenaria]XP_052801921.1 uncharacterized protein LOC128232422 isoform X2 [Mya arenaria]
MAVSTPWTSPAAPNTSVTVHPASLAKHPQIWSKSEVAVWLRWCTEEYSIEPVPPEHFDLNGKALCLLTKADFVERVPKNGDVLYNSLMKLTSKHHTVSTTKGIQDSSSSQVCDSVGANVLILPQSSASLQQSSLTAGCSTKNFVPIRPHPHPLLHAPTPLTGSFNDSVIYQRGYQLDPLVRLEQSSDCRLLWEFIYQLLSNNKYSSYVSWESHPDYVFRINNPTGLADLWGQQKNRTNMTYEKLSRALRYYYRMNIIKKVPGKRLTYRFLQSPSKIQKGQRGAKPQYRLQMEFSGTDRGEVPAQSSAPASIKTDRADSSDVSEHSSLSWPEEVRDESDIEAETADTVETVTRENGGSPECSNGTNRGNGSRFEDVTENEPKSQTSTLLPERRNAESVRHESFKTLSPSIEHNRNRLLMAGHTGRSSPYQKDIISISPFHQNGPQLLFTNNAFEAYTDKISQIQQRQSPLYHGASTYPYRTETHHEHMRQPFSYNNMLTRTRFGLGRAPSLDSATSCLCAPKPVRPGQPRSISPRFIEQTEPEDLSMRSHSNSNKASPSATYVPNSNVFNQ